MHTREVLISRNVVFFETHLPYTSHDYIFPDLHNTVSVHDTNHILTSTTPQEHHFSHPTDIPQTLPSPPNLNIDDLPSPLPAPSSPLPLSPIA